MIMIDVFENYENMYGSQFHGQEGIARKLMMCSLAMCFHYYKLTGNES